MPKVRPPKPLDFVGINTHHVADEYDMIMCEPPGLKRDELLLEFMEYWGEALMNQFRYVWAPTGRG